MEQNEIDAIKELATADGKITPESVVDAARNAGHPLHPRFEWNDGVAAEHYRIMKRTKNDGTS